MSLTKQTTNQTKPFLCDFHLWTSAGSHNGIFRENIKQHRGIFKFWTVCRDILNLTPLLFHSFSSVKFHSLVALQIVSKNNRIVPRLDCAADLQQQLQIRKPEKFLSCNTLCQSNFVMMNLSCSQSSAPCVLFIDEIDAITPKREVASKDMERRIVAQFLTCMDGEFWEQLC